MEIMENLEKKARAYILSRKVDFLFLLVAAIIGVYFNWNVVEIGIFMVFIWSILGPIPSRFLAFPALFFLVWTPFLLILSREDQAEEFAVYAYYFFAMAVIRAIVEMKNKGKEA